MPSGRSRAARILVIRLGALGDFILSLGAFAAIRAHHPEAWIVLLTTAPFVSFAEATPYFDEVWIDERPRAWRIGGVLRLRARLVGGRFDRVYDLQTSERTGWYYRLHPRPRPAWSGVVRGCSHRHDDPGRTAMHTIDRQRAQLALAGVADGPTATVAWARAPIDHVDLPCRYAVLAPGSSAHRSLKRWPAEHYGALARGLIDRDLPPVLVGTGLEAGLLDAIAAMAPGAVDLGGRTTLLELASVLRGAALVVGNDSGPVHLAAVLGRPCLALLSAASDPVKNAPRGERVAVLREPRIADLGVDRAVAAIGALAVLDSRDERPNVRAP